MTDPSCRFCGASIEFQKIRAENVFGGRPEHKFWECADCGLVYLWPTPSLEEEKKFYALEFEKFMSSRAAQERDWTGAEAHIRTNQDQVKRRMKFLEKHLHKGQDILEIGCSSGFMLDAFQKKGARPIGIEPSENFLGFLHSKGFTCYPSLEQMHAKAPGQKFDLIVHFFVLEHIRDTKEFLKEQLALLRPGGKIIAEVPCVLDPLTSLYHIPPFEKFYWSIAHHYYFSPKSLSRILDSIACQYEFAPEQRYDLSNHIVWMTEGRPGGQGRFNAVLSTETSNSYAADLKRTWHCDTFFVYINR